MKLNVKAKRGYLVGYAFRTKGYRILLPESNTIIESCNVTFDKFDYGWGKVELHWAPTIMPFSVMMVDQFQKAL